MDAFRHPAVTVLIALLLPACSNLQGARLLVPETAGLEAVAPGLFVEPGMPAAQRAEIHAALAWARDAVQAVFGDVRSSPVVHACMTQDCYETFGGRSSSAKVYGDRILLSPRGLNPYFLAHEWAHAELHQRLGAVAALSVPAWFEEGLAVAVSAAPAHSGAHWQYLGDNAIPRPSRADLLQIETGGQWLDAVKRYGEDLNQARLARGEPRVAPLYAAAGHEVRPWLAAAGPAGLDRLIEGVNAGEDFDTLYLAIVPGHGW